MMRIFNQSTTIQIIFLFTLAVVSHLVLIWLPTYPPLFDFPNHIARHYLESRWLLGDALPNGYAIHYTIVPNLGADLIVPLLLIFTTPLIAGKLFLSLSVLMYGTGATLMIAQQHGYEQKGWITAVFILPWLFNQTFFMGFINYYSGVGLALLVIWNHIRLFKKPRCTIVNLVIHSLLVTLVYLWHLVAIGTFFLMIGAHFFYLAIQSRRNRQFIRFLVKVSPLLIAVLPAVFLILDLFIGSAENALIGGLQYATLKEKFESFDTTLFGGYSRVNSAVSLFIWLIAIGATFTPSIQKINRWTWMHLSILLLCALYMVLPSSIGTTDGADSRMLPIILICVISIVGQLNIRRPRLGFWLVGITMIVRFLSIGVSWLSLSNDIEQHVAALRGLPSGSTILENDSGCDVSKLHPGLHALGWSVPERHHLVSSLFGIPGQQPLRYKWGYHDHRDHVYYEKPDRLEIDPRLIDSVYEYFWFYNYDNKCLVVPNSWRLIYHRRGITLWQIR